MIRTCGKIYEYCELCGKLVRLNKSILGSLHVCLTDEEICERENAIRQKEQQWQQMKGEVMGITQSKFNWWAQEQAEVVGE